MPNINTGSYIVRTLADLLNSGLDQQAVIKQLDAVFNAFPSIEHPGNDYGEDEKWTNLMIDNQSYVYCLVHNKLGIVGYWSCLPVSKPLYERGIDGYNINREIGQEHVDEFGLPGDYFGYFVDFYVLKSHRSMAANRKLYASFASYLRVAAQSGYYFKEIFAHTGSYDSIRLCGNAGFSYLTDHKSHVMKANDESIIATKIYRLNLSECQGKLFDLDDKLKSLYASHFRVPISGDKESFWEKLDIAAVIKGGEQSDVEFKPSLRTNLHTLKPDNKREQAVLKAIAGFLNADGGLLLIGIHDDGSVLGADVGGFRSEDEMGVHLSNILVGTVGAGFLPYIDYRFLPFSSKRVLLVRCRRGAAPAFLREEGKDYLYVRVGCATQQLNGRQLASYIERRFYSN